MKNALLFFFNINISNDKISKIGDTYYFSYNNNNFIIERYTRNIEEINDIYLLSEKMINDGFPLFKIIPTNENKEIFSFENNYYVLMIMPRIKNRIITYKDVINFNYTVENNQYKKIDKSYWEYYWSQKIDYIEYQFYQIMEKYPNIQYSINYYIGIWENAISFYNLNNEASSSDVKYVSHKRVNCKMDLLEFVKPTNFVIDYKERDVAEYIKSYIYEENYTNETIIKYLESVPKNKNNIVKFIARILFPSNYFDAYEDIIYEKENTNDKAINEIIAKNKNYIYLLQVIFEFFENNNIPEIDWIKEEKI